MIQKLRQSGTNFLWELCKRPFNRCMVLAYHSISEPLFNPWGNALTETHFAEQLDMLSRNFEVVDLAMIMQCYRKGGLPAKSVAITFDDGYANNLYRALPLLEKYEMPATFFLTTGYLNQQREFWWDELEQIILHPRKLPEQLVIDIGSQTYCWRVGDGIHFPQAEIQESQNRLASEAKQNTRLGFCYTLWKDLIRMGHLSRSNTLDQIAQWAGVKRKIRSEFRMLTAEEVQMLARHPLVTIGGHTHTHPSLPSLSSAEQQQEITQNRQILTKILGQEPTLFSYPYGDHTPQTARFVCQAGYECAFKIEPGTIWRYTNSYKLPRLSVRDCSGAAWQKRMQLWF